MIERLVLNATVLKPRQPQSLVLAPTRELALQVNESLVQFSHKTGIRSVAIFGGVGMQPQVDALKRGVHIVVATPGRLIDHMEQRNVDLSAIQILTIDEADRMMDMGFLPSLQRILSALPKQRQTMPHACSQIHDQCSGSPGSGAKQRGRNCAASHSSRAP
jgi:ATP-dependent RNA helicase RhlE